MLAVSHELQNLLYRTALSRDHSTIELLAEKQYTPRTVNANAKENSGKTAKQRLETVEPSAKLLKTSTAMISALKSASQCEIDQDVFKDANEY